MVTQGASTPWEAMSTAAGCYLIFDLNYVQILTIDMGAMELRCQTVVFRGFLKGLPSATISDALLGGMTSGSLMVMMPHWTDKDAMATA